MHCYFAVIAKCVGCMCGLHVRAWQAAVKLSFVWAQRDHEALQLADALSKWEDKADWRFSRRMAQQ